LSDPEKRKKYDKYGTVDEDHWDYEDFMKNFNFEDIFNIFDEDFFNVGYIYSN
jgi:DnaJ-class molecular chaperone